MIKTIKTFCTAFFLLTINLLSAQNLEQFIPKDATFVVTMNLNHLDKKVNLLELQQYPFYDMMLQQMGMGSDGEEAQMMHTLMTEPSKFGFDVMSKSYIYAKLEDTKTSIGMVAQLSDSQKFADFLKSIPEGATMDIQQTDGFSYVVQDDKTAFAWNDKIVLIGTVEREDTYDDFGDDFGNDFGDESYPEAVYPDEEIAFEEMEIEEEMPVFEDLEIEEEIVEIELEEESVPESLEEITEEMLEHPIEDAPMEEPEFDFSQFLPQPDPELRAMTESWLKENLVRTSENSMQNNARFVKASNNNDMHFWMDYTYVMSEMQKQQGNSFGDGMSDMVGKELMNMLMGSLYKDNFMSMGMNFNDGQWVLGIDQYSSPKLMQAMAGSFDSKYNKKMTKYVRGNELMGIYHLNFNIDKTVDGYKELMKSMANEVPIYGGMAESALEILGIFIDEQAFSNIFNGDMIFAVTGMQTVTSMQTMVEYDDDFNPTEVEREVTNDIPEMTFMMSYGNEKDMMKFIRLGAKSGVLQQTGTNFKLKVPNMDMEATLALRDGILFISNSQDLIGKNFNKKYKGKQKIDKKLCKIMCENAQVMYWDIPQTITSLKAEEMAGALGAGEFVNIGKQNFDNMLLTTAKTTVDGAYHSEFSLNFTNKNTNALKQLFDIINEMMMSAMAAGESKT